MQVDHLTAVVSDADIATEALARLLGVAPVATVELPGMAIRSFRIGDTEYTGTVVRFVPDFTMDLKTGKIATRSQEPNNPAWRVVVRKNGVPQDTSWAFLNMAPHFGQRSLIAFLAVRATFENHAPVASRDTLAIKLMEQEKR